MAQANVVTGGWRSVSAAKRAGVAGPSHRNVDHRATRAKAAVLFGREIVVGELQLEGDVRPEKHASVEFPGAVRAGRALRLPAVLRRVLDLFALRPAADEQQGGGEYDAELANASRCVSFREQTVDLPAVASFRNTGQPSGNLDCVPPSRG
jgi:hypothetical protein